jgi:RNA polymerase subunit RPABC4/transcription elongation factor Spt4
MFLIAGITARVVTLDEPAQRCPACGLFQARRQRVDHWFSLFFIPLLRVKTGQPLLVCQRCQHPTAAPSTPSTAPAEVHARHCGGCGRRLAADHRFCPFCGRGAPE